MERMKQNTGGFVYNSLTALLDDKDIEAADILLQLSDPFPESEYLRRFPSSWGVKRKRSAASGVTPSPSRVRSTPSPPSILRTRVGEDETLPIRKAEATSPATPLSFSPSESDAKSKHSLSKILKKRKKEEWLEMIAELTQRRELLKGDMETVKRDYRRLKALNLELKTRKQELSLCRNKEKPQLEMHKNLNLSMESAQPTVKFPPPSDLENKEHQLIPSMVLRMDERAFKSEMYSCGQMTPLLSSSTGLGLINRVDPLRIPDLNLSLEDDFGTDSFQPYDMSSHLIDKATAAEARKKRMQIYKVKNSIAAAKLRYGHR